MGGGNAQKAKMAREKNLEKQKGAGKGSQLEANKKAMSIQNGPPERPDDGDIEEFLLCAHSTINNGHGIITPEPLSFDS